jgi:hypothetical protein
MFSVSSNMRRHFRTHFPDGPADDATMSGEADASELGVDGHLDAGGGTDDEASDDDEDDDGIYVDHGGGI